MRDAIVRRTEVILDQAAELSALSTRGPNSRPSIFRGVTEPNRRSSHRECAKFRALNACPSTGGQARRSEWGLYGRCVAAYDAWMRIDHLSCRVRDPHATHAFYSEVVGLKLTHAFVWDQLMLVYEAPGGGRIAFTTGATGARAVAREDWEADHFGFAVDSVRVFNEIVQRIQARGIDAELHEGERIYFADPDGMILEIEVDEPWAPDPDALEKLRRWRAD